MLVEIPECKRCCCCIPLRYGLIAWGYLKLILVSLALIGACIAATYLAAETHRADPETIAIVSLLIFVLIIDIVSSITFIVGCHKKSVKLMKIFYYYSMFPLVLTTALTIYSVVINIMFIYKYAVSIYFMFLIMDAASMFAYIAIQVYILLMVRSEIIKLNTGCQFRFVNNFAEAECTLDMEQRYETAATE